MSASPFVVGVGDLLAHVGERRSIDVSGAVAAGTEMIQLEGPVRVEGVLEATPTGSSPMGIVGVGTVSATLRLVCSRCLVDWHQAVTPSFVAVFSSDPEPDMFPLDDAAIDLEPMARDELLAAVPLNAIHVPDCKGLCGTCGIDLNTATCECDETELSSPFAGLKDLFD